mmetsp:Transcript_46373/g.39096  ORF Transcript_46373/g.39096 Transcript_46373/m.39096 type:complete len:85 (-) Transcript_46373:65-319(-)
MQIARLVLSLVPCLSARTPGLISNHLHCLGRWLAAGAVVGALLIRVREGLVGLLWMWVGEAPDVPPSKLGHRQGLRDNDGPSRQ